MTEQPAPEIVFGEVEQHAFASRMAKQIRFVRIIFGLGVALMILFALILAAWDVIFEMAGRSIWMSVLLALVAVVVWFSSRGIIRNFRKIHELVPKHAGLVCPICTEPAADIGERVQCWSCTRKFTRDELVRYWKSHAGDGWTRLALYLDLVRKPTELPNWRRRLHGHRRGRLGIVMFVLFIVAMFLTIMFVLFGDSWVVFAFSLSFFVPLLIGNLLIAFGWRAPNAMHVYCAKCGYQRTPGAALGAQPVCPECAANWNEPEGTRAGKPKRRTGMQIAGAMFVLLSIVLLANPSWRESMTRNLLTTKTLTTQAMFGSTAERDTAIAELMSRSLSNEETDDVARAILDYRDRKFTIPPELDDWIVAQIADHKLSRHVVRAYYQTALDLELIGPLDVRVGDTVEYGIRSLCLSAGDNPQPFVFLGGYTVNGELQRDTRMLEAIDGRNLGLERVSSNGLTSKRGVGPTLTLTPTEPGEIEILMDVWIMFLTPDLVYDITWNEDGSPVKPEGSAWTEKRTLQRVIEVKR